jgi:hypothetical protein
LNLLYGNMLVLDMFEEVVRQPEATKAVSDAIRLTYSGLTNPGRPVASFLLVGPTGTGKTMLDENRKTTELPLMIVINRLTPFVQLAKILFDSPEAMVRIDANEYSEKHFVARLVSCVDLIAILPLRLFFFSSSDWLPSRLCGL